MLTRTDRAHATKDVSVAEVDQALREHLEAIQASVAASRALLTAGPGDRTRAHRAFMDATRRQAEAERNYERVRQLHRGAPYAGRPR